MLSSRNKTLRSSRLFDTFDRTHPISQRFGMIGTLWKRILVSLPTFSSLAQLLPASEMPLILPMRERARVRDAWLEVRLQKVVAELIRQR